MEQMTMKKHSTPLQLLIFCVLVFLVVVFLTPVFFVLLNSFKGKLFISDNPFALPTSETFAGFTNYLNGIEKTGFFSAFGWSLFITVGSVLGILLFTSMTAYYITRVKSKFSSVIYYMFVFSMIVPFQMVMFTMSKLADSLKLNNPLGMVMLYVGFGAGLSVFMFTGFIKSIPIEIEEAAMIDGCNPLQTFFQVVLPILKPTAITVAILNAMWIWNDYLLPYLVIGISTRFKTIPVAVQYLIGSYGSKDMGAMMALLVLSIIPIVIFYLFCQKYIIEGVVAGAVKG
jgi:raffinose/stachyose/melibiose transport system permease protein